MVKTETLTREEVREELDRQARERFGLSADAFVDCYRSGALDLSSPVVSRLAILARLLETEPAAGNRRRRRFERLLLGH